MSPVFGPGVDQRILMVDCGTSANCVPNEAGSDTQYYFADRLGNVLAVTDNTGAIQQRFFYTPFGVEMEGDPTGNPFRYTGRRYDPETGLYYYRARYYDADLGRFLQVDPIGYADQWNLYAYVGNNPLNYTDPTGEEKYTLNFGARAAVAQVGGRAAVSISFDSENGQLTIQGGIGYKTGLAVGGNASFSVSESSTEAASSGVYSEVGARAAVEASGEINAGPLGSANAEAGLQLGISGRSDGDGIPDIAQPAFADANVSRGTGNGHQSYGVDFDIGASAETTYDVGVDIDTHAIAGAVSDFASDAVQTIEQTARCAGSGGRSSGC